MIPKAIRRASLGHMGMPRPLASGGCDITNLPSTANAVHVAVFHDPFRYPRGAGASGTWGMAVGPPHAGLVALPPPVSRTDPGVEVRARPRPWRRGTPALAGDGHDDVL